MRLAVRPKPSCSSTSKCSITDTVCTPRSAIRVPWSLTRCNRSVKLSQKSWGGCPLQLCALNPVSSKAGELQNDFKDKNGSLSSLESLRSLGSFGSLILIALRHPRRRPRGRQGQEHREGGPALRGLGFDADLSAVGLDQVAHGHQAEAGALLL